MDQFPSITSAERVLSFGDSILSGHGRDLVQQLADVCERSGTRATIFDFGSNWIMLGNQADAEQYLQRAYDAA